MGAGSSKNGLIPNDINRYDQSKLYRLLEEIDSKIQKHQNISRRAGKNIAKAQLNISKKESAKEAANNKIANYTENKTEVKSRIANKRFQKSQRRAQEQLQKKSQVNAGV